MSKTTNQWIRTVYLYLFALVGLAISVIGLVMLINLGLKAWVFTKADIQNRYIEKPVPLSLDRDLQTVQDIQSCSEVCELSDTQKQQIAIWLADYDTWRANLDSQQEIDYVTSSRQQQASTAIAMIIVGVPLYLYHWAVIKRDRRKEEHLLLLF